MEVGEGWRAASAAHRFLSASVPGPLDVRSATDAVLLAVSALADPLRHWSRADPDEAAALIAERWARLFRAAVRVLLSVDGALRRRGDHGDAGLWVGEDIGPGREAHSSGRLVAIEGVAAIDRRWPASAAQWRAAGVSAVYGIPLTAGGQAVGAIELWRDEPLTGEDLRLATALADALSHLVVHQKEARDLARRAEQLEGALASRVVIEQAKGMIATLTGGDLQQAFRHLRDYARDHNLKIAAAARHVVTGVARPADLAQRRA